MILTSQDYQNLLYSRVDKLREMLYTHQSRGGGGGGGVPQAVNTAAFALGDEDRPLVPDFEGLKMALDDIGVVLQEFEDSLGPN